MKHHGFKSSIGLCMVLALCATPPAGAQNASPGLNLQVVEGEGAANGARQSVSHDPAVKLEDEDHRPIAGAVVVFSLPVSGPSGEFLNGSKNLTVVTDANGVAVAHGLRTNGLAGKLQIYVTAAHRGLRARTLINQFVEPAAGARLGTPELRTSKAGGKWKWVVLGVAAAGGAGAAMYFKHHSTASTPVSISAGTVVFGSPR